MNTAINHDLMLEPELAFSRQIIDRFLSSCSHDLKGPLCSIQGLLTIASKYEQSNELHECHDMINACVEKMKHMLELFETYTTLLQKELTETEIEAEQFVRNIMREHEAAINSTGVNVEIQVENEDKWIADARCNSFVVSSLVSNAINFNDPRKERKQVLIGIKVFKDRVHIQINDNGIGIRETAKEKLFMPFYRGTTIRSGFGVGLFLAKGMARKLRAKLSITSSENVGTTVDFVTPNYAAIKWHQGPLA